MVEIGVEFLDIEVLHYKSNEIIPKTPKHKLKYPFEVLII